MVETNRETGASSASLQSRPLTVAYADPPYEGLAHKYPEKREVNHAELIEHLRTQYPDGWALSCKANSIRNLWPLCPPDVRLGVWVKTWAPALMNVRPPYCFEGVLFRGGRRTKGNLERDWIACAPTVKQKVLGTKPKLFAFWLFRVLGLEPGDEMADLFPGSGAVSAHWETYCTEFPTLPIPPTLQLAELVG